MCSCDTENCNKGKCEANDCKDVNIEHGKITTVSEKMTIGLPLIVALISVGVVAVIVVFATVMNVIMKKQRKDKLNVNQTA